MEQEINNMGVPPQKVQKGNIGAMISIIIIVLVLLLGASYFFKQVPINSSNESSLTPAEIAADTTISSLSTQGSSTNIADIQKDLNATDLSGLDAGLGDISI